MLSGMEALGCSWMNFFFLLFFLGIIQVLFSIFQLSPINAFILIVQGSDYYNKEDSITHVVPVHFVLYSLLSF